MTKPLASRLALVTGASRGIGYATALGLAKAGAHIIAVARTQGGLEELDDTIRAIAHDLTAIVRRDAKTDWQVKESVRAKLRTSIKRLLLKHGYPPDQEPAATELILQQAERQAEDAS